jgi:hypothetical protein
MLLLICWFEIYVGMAMLFFSCLFLSFDGSLVFVGSVSWERAAHTVGLGSYVIYGKIKEENCGFMAVWYIWKIKEDIYGKINEEVQ